MGKLFQAVINYYHVYSKYNIMFLHSWLFKKIILNEMFTNSGSICETQFMSHVNSFCKLYINFSYIVIACELVEIVMSVWNIGTYIYIYMNILR